MLKKIVKAYFFSIIFFGSFYYLSNIFLNPTVTTSKDNTSSEILSQIKVIDFINYERKLYILSENHKVYIFDPYKNKIDKTYDVQGIDNITKITAFNHIKIGRNKEDKLYIAFLSGNSVYLSKINTKAESLKPELIFEELSTPADIYIYNEYYYLSQSEDSKTFQYYDNLVVLERQDKKKILNVYSLETKKLLESLDAEIEINSFNFSRVKTIEPKSIINFMRRNMDDGTKKRVFLNKIETASNNDIFSSNLGTITKTRCSSYVLPDYKNSALWVYNGVGLLLKQQMIKLDKTPHKAYIFEESIPSFCSDDMITKGTEKFKIFVLYKGSNRIEILQTTNSILKILADISSTIYWALISPFILLALIFTGKIG